MLKRIIQTLPILVFAGICLVITGCEDEQKSTWETYKDWREFNQEWLNGQLSRTNADGTPFYRQCVMPTDPQAVIYMHNIGEVHSENLQPLFTSTAKVNYTVTLANDSVLDKGTNYLCQLSSKSLITGWSLAVMQLHVGDSAQFVLPYNVAYGTSGASRVPPYSNLQFNMKLVDITAYEIQP